MKKLTILCVLMIYGVVSASGYTNKVLSIQPAHLIQYLPMNEDTGTTAFDLSGNSRNGTYTACTLSQAGFKTGSKSVKFNGSNASANIYSEALSVAFNPSEGSLSTWCYSAATPWGGSGGAANVRVIAKLYYSVQDYLQIAGVSTGSGAYLQLYNIHKNTATLKQITFASDVTTFSKFLNITFTWSVTNNNIKYYVNGVLVNSAAYDGWNSGALSNNIGLQTLGRWNNDYPFLGNLQNFALWDVALDSTDCKKLINPSALFMGDSYTSGTGASTAANRWVNKLCTRLNIIDFLNKGISGTVLQNTVQNAVAVIGGAQTNNGRDRYVSDVAQWGPDRVYFYYNGYNDLRLSDAAFSVDSFKADLDEIVSGLISSGINKSNIYLGSPPYISNYTTASAPWDGGTSTKSQQYTTATYAVAKKYNIKFADVGAITNSRRNLIYSDSIHYNDSGHTVISDVFYNAVSVGSGGKSLLQRIGNYIGIGL